MSVRVNEPVIAALQPLRTLDNPRLGTLFYDDFNTFAATSATAFTDTYAVTQATSGTVAVSATESGGVLNFSAGASTQGQGIQIQHRAGYYLMASGRNAGFKVRIRFDANPTTLQFFAGLATIDTSIIGSNENSATSAIGFQMSATTQSAAAGTLYYITRASGSNTGTLLSTGLAVTTGRWYTLSFEVIGSSTVNFYVYDEYANVLYGPFTVVTTNIPTAAVTEAIVCQANGTSTPTLSADFLQSGQDRIWT